MNIVLSFPDCHRRGGVERILVECANFLAGRGHQTSVLSAQFDPAVLAPGIRQIRVPVRSSQRLLRLHGYRKSAAALLAGLQQDNNPAVHAGFGVVCPPGAVLWVQSVHAEWLRIARSSRSLAGRLKQRLNLFHPFILRLERDYYGRRRYRRLIALTPRVRQELVEHYLVPEHDIDLLPNGYNPLEFNTDHRARDREATRLELGYQPSDKVLLFVANELDRKGFFPLAEAVASLKESQIKVLLVGRVSLDPHQEMLRRLGIQRQLRCVGPSSDVARYYAAADLFVLPTQYEAWGLVIVEALACGLPVLTSRLAGAAVAVQEGRTGLLLDDPRDPAQIARHLDRLLRAAGPPPEVISQSVAAYQWPTLLLQYEKILAEHAA